MLIKSRKFVFWLFCILALPKITISGVEYEQSHQYTIYNFYAILDSFQNNPDEQENALQIFLHKNPDFEDAYTFLLNKYIYDKKLEYALKFFTRLADNTDYPNNSYWMIARIYYLLNQSENAFEYYIKALRQKNPSPKLIFSFARFVHVHQKYFKKYSSISGLNLGKNEQALFSALKNYVNHRFSNAIQIFHQVNQNHFKKNTAFLYSIIGDCYLNTKNYDLAKEYWLDGYRIVDNQANYFEKAQFLLQFGSLAIYQKKYSVAESYLDSAITIVSKLENLELRQKIMGYRGVLSLKMGKFELAKNVLLKAISLCTQLSNDHYLPIWYYYYGLVAVSQKKFDEAIVAYERCENLTKKVLLTNYLIKVWLKKGETYQLLGQNELAKQMYEKAFKLAQSNAFTKEKIISQSGLADILMAEGNFDLARKKYQECIQLLLENGDKSGAGFLSKKLGDSYKMQDNYDSAQIAYDTAFDLAEKENLISYVAWYLTESAKIELLKNNIPTARRLFNKAIKIDTTKVNLFITMDFHLALGIAYKKAQKYSEAISSLKKSANLIEISRSQLRVEQLRIGYFSQQQIVYRELANCYMQRYKREKRSAVLDSVFFYTELVRGRALKEKYGRKHRVQSDPEYLKSREFLLRKQRALRLMSEDLEEFVDQESLKADIEIARYTFLNQKLKIKDIDSTDQVSGNIHFPSLDSLKMRLQARNRGLISYNITDESSFALVVSGDSLHAIPLHVNADSISTLVQSLMAPFHDIQQFDATNLPFRADIAHELYTILFKPIELAVELPKNLLIVPDIPIINLPFDMLLSERSGKAVYMPNDQPDYAGHFLVKSYTINYIPGASLLAKLDESPKRKPEVFVVANPFDKEKIMSTTAKTQLRSLTGWRFDPLIFADVEAKRIKDIYAKTKIVSGAKATKSQFRSRAENADFIHIATHGFVDTTFADFSGLVFAMSEDSTDDGLLMGYEIADFNLKADLVTMSACETGRGKSVPGEGVLGLPRLFLGAGAKSVQMTLWKVDDRFASELMPKFYDFLLNDRLSKAEALAQAKRVMLESEQAPNGIYYQHPFYWASFTLYGDSGVSRKTTNLANHFFLLLFIPFVFVLLFYLRKRKA